MLSLFRKWRRARRLRQALVEYDAHDLIARFGDEGAHFEAVTRYMDEMRNVAIDGNRPPDHWSAVAVEIAKLTNRRQPKDWSGYSPE
ncbi:hypothetical protein [Methylosinus sp. Sm6]|uniref:hypothetical protein n=1 Tax=Methylosinus sp. Sm6 TaxID=2866948 RepID=UPI001C9A0A49|nr:hypothetical protein [Methylosinus sp. Sm6]MBY6242813.1 hypothetical protein [Methylosinus sp. Sm6]